MKNFFLFSLIFFLLSCNNTEQNSIVENVTDTAPTTEGVSTTENEFVPLAETINTLYKQFLFDKKLASEYRKSNVLLVKNGDNYAINKNYQSSIQEIEAVTYTTPPELELLGDNFAKVIDVGYWDKETLDASNYVLGFTVIKPTLVFCGILEHWTEKVESFGTNDGLYFSMKAFEKKGANWTDVSNTLLTQDYKDFLLTQFKSNEVIEKEDGIFAITCSDCFRFNINQEGLSISKRSSQKTDMYFFKTGADGALFMGVE